MDGDWQTVVLGATLPVGRAERTALRAALVALWEAQHGPLGALDDDLARTRALFSPVSKSGTVRQTLAALGAIPALGRVPDTPLVEAGPDGRPLVSPEGRVAIELLAAAPDVAGADAATGLLELYRDISRHRLRQVTGDWADTGKLAQVPAIGLLILLLFNGNVGEDAALPRGDEDVAVERAVARAVEAFAAVVASSHRRTRQAGPRRLGSWELGELTRRQDHIVFRDASRLYVVPDGEPAATAAAGRLLARRRKLTGERLADGLDALSAACRAEAPLLVEHGLSVGDDQRHRQSPQRRAGRV